jgi:hypothetical protein
LIHEQIQIEVPAIGPQESRTADDLTRAVYSIGSTGADRDGGRAAAGPKHRCICCRVVRGAINGIHARNLTGTVDGVRKAAGDIT